MLLVDIIIAVMLMISIVYLWQLNKKIIEIRNSKNEFRKITKNLDDAILRSEISIEELKTLTTNTNLDLGNKIERAKFLSDDLAFLTDRASSLADDLDKAISIARELQKSVVHREEPKKEPAKLQITPPAAQPMSAPQPSKKVAIESLLARISAVKKNKETSDG
jgi:hypothetical protein